MADHYNVEESEILTPKRRGRVPEMSRLVAIHLIRTNYYYEIKWKDLSKLFGYKTPEGIINLNTRATRILRETDLTELQNKINETRGHTKGS